MELKSEIKMGSKAHLSKINHRQKRRPEDRSAIDERWDQTFGHKDTEQCDDEPEDAT